MLEQFVLSNWSKRTKSFFKGTVLFLPTQEQIKNGGNLRFQSHSCSTHEQCSTAWHSTRRQGKSKISSAKKKFIIFKPFSCAIAYSVNYLYRVILDFWAKIAFLPKAISFYWFRLAFVRLKVPKVDRSKWYKSNTKICLQLGIKSF